IFLTAAQSVFGLTLLLTFRLSLRGAAALAVLFFIQFFIPIGGIRLIIAWLYLTLAAGFLLLNWRHLRFVAMLRLLFARIGSTPG
ncbi:MAG: sodium:proton exchanger, partial [Ktedonobacterales bacterium]|nr:sodium:proton exchanger [Ktedonobacterales bacterium]